MPPCLLASMVGLRQKPSADRLAPTGYRDKPPRLPFLGSERETVTPADGMGVLIFGDSGYTPQDERGGLEQSAGLAWVSGLPTRNRRAGQKAEAVGSAE